jgi:predicted nucleic acid-binding Zn ribbon protein
MPAYTYVCGNCSSEGVRTNVTIDTRDDQICETCGMILIRKIDRPGLIQIK